MPPRLPPGVEKLLADDQALPEERMESESDEGDSLKSELQDLISEYGAAAVMAAAETMCRRRGGKQGYSEGGLGDSGAMSGSSSPSSPG